MKLQNLTVIFIIIIIPVILLVSLYISTGLRTIKYQSLYDTGLLTATHDAIYAFELNTSNNELSDNPEIKRSIIKSSIKMFERSLANTCGISAYNLEDIEEYIPAIVFGMYDGFYMYAPSVIYNGDKKEYKHNLKNYVYYSENINLGTSSNPNYATIIYSLDNHVTVSGKFDGTNYELKEGYLAVGASEDGKEYQSIEIVEENIDGHKTDAINYYKDAYKFTEWFNQKIGNNVKDENNKKYLYINSDNNPEDENSIFVKHKRNIMKNKIENVLNSSITAFSERRLGKTYKMPKLSEEDWQKIYSNISMITFFQGKRIGLTRYNGYCVLNSTNSNEYVNSNLMYFIDEEGYYHDIRCEKCIDILEDGGTLTGYKIGSFAKRKEEQKDENGDTKVDENGNVLYEYTYDHAELGCYYCVNGQISTANSVEQYVSATDEVKSAYWTSLGRERYNQVYLSKGKKDDTQNSYTITYNMGTTETNQMEAQTSHESQPITIHNTTPIVTDGSKIFLHWIDQDGNIYNPGQTITLEENVTLTAVWADIERLEIVQNKMVYAGESLMNCVTLTAHYTNGNDIEVSNYTYIPNGILNQNTEVTFSYANLSVDYTIQVGNVKVITSSGSHTIYHNLIDALNSCQNGDIIQMNNKETINQHIRINKNITLKGVKIETSSYITINNGVIVNVEDSEIIAKNVNNGRHTIVNYGNLTISGNTIVSNKDTQAWNAIYNYGTGNNNSGILTMNGGIYEVFGQQTVIGINSGKVNINSATVKASPNHRDNTGIWITSGTLTYSKTNLEIQGARTNIYKESRATVIEIN